MAHVSNFLQAGEQILLDLINADNAKELPLTAVSFAAPAAVGGEAAAEATSVVVSANSGSGYKGSQTFTYNRVPMSFMNANEPDLVVETVEETIHALIPFLNSTFGIQLTEADIVDGPIAAQEPNVNAVITITATPESLVFVGSVDLVSTLPLVDLATLLTVTELDGLYAPEAVVEEPAGE